MSDEASRAVVLARGCGPLGNALAGGLERFGWEPLILDSRTAVSGAASLRVELTDSDAIKRELFGFARTRGLLAALVLLPENPTHRDPEEPWEDAAVRGLAQSTSIVRAAAPTLRPGGRIVLVPARPRHHGRDQAHPRVSPLEAIIELGVAGIATELGVPLIRCPLPAVGEAGQRDQTHELLAAITGPSRRSREVEVGLSAAGKPRAAPHDARGTEHVPAGSLQPNEAWNATVGQQTTAATKAGSRLSERTSR